MKSGFATLVGRPNVGKSTLVNAMVGTKVSITSARPQTTRGQVRGVYHGPRAQVVFVDTPGIHKPRSPFGAQLNAAATGAVADAQEGVDVVCLVLDATAALGKGDRFVAQRVPTSALCVVNKVDVASRAQVLSQLTRAGELGLAEYFPVSATSGQGVEALREAIVARLPEGPAYYPPDMVADTGQAAWVADLVREQLLARVRDELPHALACRVTEWDWPMIRCEVLVERESQKPIIIGRGGLVLKEVGTAVREQLPPGAYLELSVVVESDWRRRYAGEATGVGPLH
ncbi:MAG: GTPase Era [Acidimicrobiales bacterium]